jgi:hypothetical protein
VTGRRISGLAASGLVLAIMVAMFWIGGRSAEDQLSPLRAGLDDANIYFRYARNVAHGFGCVFNPRGERVEGVSSLSWFAVCTAAYLVTDAPERALFAVSVVLASLAAWMIASRLARAADPAGGGVATLCAGIVVACWIAASPGHVVWMSATIMDAALWTFVLVLAWSAGVAFAGEPEAARRRAGFGMSLGLVAVGRPEGPLAGLALLAGAAIAARAKVGAAAALRSLVVPAAMFAGATAAVVLARRAYFGQWLPNTYYAKIDGDLSYRVEKGLEYVASFIAAYPAASAATAIASAFLVFRPGGAASTCAIALLLAGAANAVFVGGDHFGSWRLFQPTWVLMLVPIATALLRLGRGALQPRMAALIVVVLSVVTLLVGPARWDRLRDTSGLRGSFWIATLGRPVGMSLNEVFSQAPRPVVGVVASGAFPLVYEGDSFDLLGLNDVEMAHATTTRRSEMHGHGAFDAPTFFRRAPDLLIGLMRPSPVDAPAPPEERVPFAAFSPEQERLFDALYAPVAIATRASYAEGVMLPAWARRDWLEQNAGRFPIREIVRSGDAWTYK